MRKNLLVCCLLLAVTFQAQTTFQSDSRNLSVSYGFPNLYNRYLRSIFDGSDRYQSQYVTYYNENFDYSRSGLGSLFVKYEMGLSKRIGLNFVASYLGASVTQTNTYKPSTNSGIFNYEDQTEINIKMISLGLRLNFHFGNFKKIDPYIGFAAGFSYLKSDINFISDYPSAKVNPRLNPENPIGIPLYLALSLGCKFYLTKNFGIFAEAGFDNWSIAQCGLVYKIH